MTWLTLRQFRAQAIVAVAAMATLAVTLVPLGVLLRHAYAASAQACGGSGACLDGGAAAYFSYHYGDAVHGLRLLLLVTPGLIGAFWGAPMIARELETGTYRLVWTQSVGRYRWLAAKLSLPALVSAVLAGGFSLLLTWSARPWDQADDQRFAAFTFATRGLTPIGYAVFAFVLGTTLGLLVRRTVPAMALTLVAFAAVQLVMPLGLRAHLLPPVTLRVAATASTLHGQPLAFEGGTTGGPGTGSPISSIAVDDYTIPRAWVLTPRSAFLTSDGRPASGPGVDACVRPEVPDAGTCLSRLNLHFVIRYEPADRYWLLQGLETAIFLALALVLGAVCRWRIPRVRA